MQFSESIEEFLADQWDKKIEADILAGRLDVAGKRADGDFIAGRVILLDATGIDHKDGRKKL